MRFKLDENLPVEAAHVLTAAGHDTLTVLDQRMKGHADPKIAIACLAEPRALISLDLDFADIRAYPPGDYFGIVVLRPWRHDKNAELARFARLLPSIRFEPLEKHLWIVDEHSIRIRPG